jgi:CHAT domain-containing protein
MSTCVTSEETLAAFIDGRLDAEARNRVVQHVSVCAGCRDIVVGVGELGEAAAESTNVTEGRFGWRGLAALTAAAAAVLLLFYGPLREQFFERDGMQSLVAASNTLPQRNVQARLSGDFAYRPLQPTDRGAGKSLEDSAPVALLAAASKIQSESHAHTPRQLHLIGVSDLLLGKRTQAVANLESAVRKQANVYDINQAIAHCSDVSLLTDLTSAYYELARFSGESAFYVKAGEAAQRAWRLERSPATVWNRALTLEALHLRPDAIRGWNEYLTLDAQSAWAVEAREKHLANLRRESRLRNSTKFGDLLQQRRGPDRATRLRAAIAADPQVARSYAEEELFDAYVTAEDRGDSKAAADIVSDLALIADEIEHSRGESLLRDSVATLRSAEGFARENLLAGLREYARGRKLYGKQEMRAARAALSDATSLLEAGRSPFALKALTYAATAAYYVGDTEAARASLVPRLQSAVARRYFNCAGEMSWLLGLIDAARGAGSQSIQSYEKSQQWFDFINERENSAAVTARLAAMLSHVGRLDEAWQHRADAIRTIASVADDDVRLQPLLLDAARAADDEGYPLIALAFQERFASIAATGSDAVAQSTALQGLAIAQLHAGDVRSAATTANLSIVAANRVADPAMRTKCMVNATIAEAKVLRATDPTRAIAKIADALDYLRRTGNRLRETELQVESAEAYVDLGQVERAIQSLRRAATELETQRAALTTAPERRAFLDHSQAIADALMEILIEHGRGAEAFDASESRRGRAVVEEASGNARIAAPVNHEAIRRHLPSDVTLVEYAVLPKRVVAWIVQRDGIRVHDLPIEPARLRSKIDELAAACLRDDRTGCLRAAEILHAWLIAPLPSNLLPRLVIIPDHFLFAVAYPILRDERSGRFLIEDHEIVVSPSATLYLDGLAKLRPSSTNESVVAIGNPSAASYAAVSNLAEADREARAVAAMYPTATLLTGARATKQYFEAAAASASVIHYAGHSSDSRLLLAGSRTSATLDADEIACIRALSSVQLVVLSACSTESGSVATDGPSSVARAFISAGVPAVVSTLWPVADDQASALVLAFHRKLRHGDSAAAALRNAQIDALKSETGRHSVRTWGAYVLYM